MASASVAKTQSAINGKIDSKVNTGTEQNGVRQPKVTKKKPPPKPRDKSPTAYFSDGRRPIDLVLAYRPMDVSARKRVLHAKYRRNFENQLRAQGLELEYESKHLSIDGKTAYVKIHAPFDVLARQAELRHLRKPTHPCDIPMAKKSQNMLSQWYNKIFHDPFCLQSHLQYPFTDNFTSPFRRKHQKDFIGCLDQRDTFFTPAERVYLTWDTLKNATIEVKRKRKFIEKPIVDIGNVILDPHAKFGEMYRRPSEFHVTSIEENKKGPDDKLRVGIDYLMQTKVYESAYALHDSDLDSQHFEQYKNKPVTKWPMRMYLYEAWVKPTQLFRHQPLDAIRDYYGERVAFYFAWLGFYTKMLIIPAIVGCLVLIYGGAGMGDNAVSSQICHNATIGKMIICRNCPDEDCLYTHLNHYCSTALVSEIFDNEITVAFALFIAIWAVVFLAHWRWYRTELMERWDISDEAEEENDPDQEQVRPEYEMMASDRRRNPVTGMFEPYFPMKWRIKRVAASLVTIAFMFLIIAGFIAGIMIYRVVGPWLWLDALEGTNMNESIDFGLWTMATSAIATGIFIGIMSKIYRFLAVYLTRAEYPRTDSEYEKAYTYKVVIFECVNYYSALFYLAFVHGQFTPAPHRQGEYQGQCQVTGCLLDLVIQLAVIYAGKQFFDSVVDILVPLIGAFWRNSVRAIKRKLGKEQSKTVRWESDHDLEPTSKIFLFSDYLKLFIQYGFVTMFVAAFPLAPMLALLNNVLSIRLDAYKVLILNRRSVPIPLNQGVDWAKLVRMLGKLAIITNALLIAMTTEFIPRTIFMIEYSQDGTLSGYIEFRLSKFNTSDWIEDDADYELLQWNNITVEECYYRGFLQSPSEQDPHGLPAYARRKEFWHVLIARMAFVIVFEHFIFLLQWLTEYMIPALPKQIKMRKQREEFLERERFMKDENKTTHVANGPDKVKDNSKQ